MTVEKALSFSIFPKTSYFANDFDVEEIERKDDRIWRGDLDAIGK